MEIESISGKGTGYFMIRAFKIEDLDCVMELWLNTNIAAHDFIPENYWKQNFELVKGLLPQSQLYVYESGDQVQGFIGLQESYIAGIFVHNELQSRGIGKQLLDYVKLPKKQLSLSVYEKNSKAVRFYLRGGFQICTRQREEATGEIELRMEWSISSAVEGLGAEH